MIDIGKFIVIDRLSARPVYLQIVHNIIGLIQDGVLPSGVKIQPTRDLSRDIGVHRNTVVAAYNELDAQGWIAIKARKGCYISQSLPNLNPITLVSEGDGAMIYPRQTAYAVAHELKEELMTQYPSGKSKYVFNEGFPDIRLTPLKELLREYQSIGNRKISRRHLSYSAKEGSMRLRHELVKMLRQTRGLSIGIENVLITKGAQMAIYLAASLLLKPGDNRVCFYERT